MAWETAKKKYFNNWRVQRPQNIINKPGLFDRFLKKNFQHFFKKWHFPETQLYLVYNSILKQNAQNAKKMLHFLFLTLGSQVTRAFLSIKPFTSLNRPQFFFSLGNAHFLKRLQYQIVVLKLEKLRFVVQTGAVNKQVCTLYD